MPKQQCASCSLTIDRIAGIQSHSVLCAKCSRLFHFDCLNPDSSVYTTICTACTSAQPIRRSVHIRQPTFSLSTTADLPVATLQAQTVSVTSTSVKASPALTESVSSPRAAISQAQIDSTGHSSLCIAGRFPAAFKNFSYPVFLLDAT